MNSNAAILVLDMDEALLRFSGNRQIFVKLLLRFLELNAQVREKAEGVVQGGDCDDIVLFFHSIKGGAANLSAKRLAAQSALLENLARVGDVEGIKQELPAFHALFEEVAIAARELSDSTP
ncbi:MAG: Hpt domain-containing protein [Desulfomicrobium apsheronum]|nr:Hpt domain-containing protein [Desulfomicrobium apsheronum]